MIYSNIASQILFAPLTTGVDSLYILSAYATPTMLSWYMKNLYRKTLFPIRIHLTIGMVPFDGVSDSVHKGFLQLLHEPKPAEVSRLDCSYIFDNPAIHSNLYIWTKDSIPVKAYTGSANFVQNSFVGTHRQEIMVECDPMEAMQYYEQQIDRSVFANHAEVEEYVRVYQKHPILDRENDFLADLKGGSYDTVTLSLLTNKGEIGIRSGLNWGNRPHRNPNEAYIPLPREIARSGFFPLEKRHFSVLTDDRHHLILRVEQQNDKAITTPARNSDLGEYFRNRLGLPNGAFIKKESLQQYGRTDVTFFKMDEETYCMDFSV